MIQYCSLQELIGHISSRNHSEFDLRLQAEQVTVAHRGRQAVTITRAADTAGVMAVMA